MIVTQNRQARELFLDQELYLEKAFHIGRLSQQLQNPVERHNSGTKEIS